MDGASCKTHGTNRSNPRRSQRLQNNNLDFKRNAANFALHPKSGVNRRSCANERNGKGRKLVGPYCETEDKPQASKRRRRGRPAAHSPKHKSTKQTTHANSRNYTISTRGTDRPRATALHVKHLKCGLTEYYNSIRPKPTVRNIQYFDSSTSNNNTTTARGTTSTGLATTSTRLRSSTGPVTSTRPPGLVTLPPSAAQVISFYSNCSRLAVEQEFTWYCKEDGPPGRFEVCQYQSSVKVRLSVAKERSVGRLEVLIAKARATMTSPMSIAPPSIVITSPPNHPVATNSGKRKLDTSRTPPPPPPPHSTASYLSNSTNTSGSSLSPRSWIFHTPDKQKLAKFQHMLPAALDEPVEIAVPVMLHHSKRLKTVYSFDGSSSELNEARRGGGMRGGVLLDEGEVRIDSDRLAPICQISTQDDGADCEFETSSVSDITLSCLSQVSGQGPGLENEENQFQLQDNELSLDFHNSRGCASSSNMVGGGYMRGGAGDGEGGEGAFLDQWVRSMGGGGGGGDCSPLKPLHLSNHPNPNRNPFNFKPILSPTNYDRLRTIHNVATQRPSKTQSRMDRRQILERKSLTFEEMNNTPKSSCGYGSSGGGNDGLQRMRALKQKAASVGSIIDLDVSGEGGGGGGGAGGLWCANLFDAAPIGALTRQAHPHTETVTSGAYTREQLANQPGQMRLLLGNLQMGEAFDMTFDPAPLLPRRNY